VKPRQKRAIKKTDRWSVFVLGLASLLVGTQAAQAQGLGEIDATRAFCEHSLVQAITDETTQRGDALVHQSEVLPNPSLSINHERVFGSASEHETVIGIGVPLGIGGKRFVLQDAAAAWKSQFQLADRADRMAAALAFRQALVGASVDQAHVDVHRRQQQRFATLIATLNKLAGAGEGSEHDRLRLQTEADLHTASMVPLEASVAAQRAWLKTMAGAPVTLATDPATWAQRPGPVQGPSDHPQVASLRAAARAHGLQARAADRRWVPDLDVFAGYRLVGGTGPTAHGFSVGVSFPLTLFDHGQGEARRAQAEQALASAKADRAERDQRAALNAAAAKMSVLERSAAQLSRALAVADELRNDTERLYLADESSLLEVLEAHRRISALSSAHIDIQAQLAYARLAVMAASGRFDTPQLDKSCRGEP